MQGPERFANGVPFPGALEAEQRVRLMVAQRLREGDLLLGGTPCDRDVGRAAARDELLGEPLDRGGALLRGSRA